jgi:hypothetical protein
MSHHDPAARSEATMIRLIDKHVFEKAGTVMTEAAILGGFAACALAAVLFDLWSLVR